ncbi:MAG: ferritin-like domain-containing protein [Minicystis sp.]
MDLYAALLAPIAWRIPGHAARMLHGFARAEQGSMIDLVAAANLTTSPARRALYLRHALDESRHASMFAHRSAELQKTRGLPPIGPVLADSEQLFERLGELRFLAFVHLGEARGRVQFAAHIRTCKRRGDERSVALLTAIEADEARHEQYTRELLVELSGGEREARRAVRRAKLWEAWRLWRRAGRWMAAKVYAALMMIVFVAVAPLSLLVRVVRPARPGWTGEREARS